MNRLRDAQVGRVTTACAPTVAPATGAEPPCKPAVLKDGYTPWWFGRLLSMACRPSSPLLMVVDEARRTPPRFFKAATHSESSGDEYGILEDDVRLQPALAAAPPDQPYYPDSSRLVCCSRSGPMRGGIPSVLALIGAYDSVFRCTPGDHFSK